MPDTKQPPAWAMKAAIEASHVGIGDGDFGLQEWREAVARIIADACPAGKPCKVCGREIAIPFAALSDWCTGCGAVREKMAEWEKAQ